MFEGPSGIKQVRAFVHKRLNTASGPYQMFGHLADAIIVTNRLEKGNMVSRFVYREEVPVRYLREVAASKWCMEAMTKGAGACGVIALTLEYGHDPLPVGKRDPFAEDRVGFTGETSHFLHPIFRVYETGDVMGTEPATGWFSAENKTQLAEQPLTDWDRPEFREDVGSLFDRLMDRHKNYLFRQAGHDARTPMDTDLEEADGDSDL